MEVKKFASEAAAEASGPAAAAFCLLWAFLPLAAPGGSLPAPILAPGALLREVPGSAGALAYAAVAAALLCALWRAAAEIIRRLPGRAAVPRVLLDFSDPRGIFAAGSDAVASAAILGLHALHAAAIASGPAYFAAYPWWAWLSAALALGWNAWSLASLIRGFEKRDPSYAQYRAFRNASKAAEKTRGGIQRRLTVVFAALLLSVVAILSAVLLRDFGKTLLAAVIDNGGALAERTASVVKTNAGDRIAIDDYFAIERTKNGKAAFPFKALSYFRLDPKKGKSAVAATTAAEGAAPEPADELPKELELREDRTAGTIEFRSPVVLSGKTIGYASVVYDRAVIYEPYYRTSVKAAMIAFLFLYVSIFLTYLIGRGIVAPILFLGMSVNDLTGRLAAMVGGQEKVSADRLRYEDRVATKDEIKRLSTEIGRMATVIRGVVPYISASTLQHSGKGAPSTDRRDLTFLFTDIRGFTTFCEGRSPEEVVSLLNHYLDLQTEAILANGGDVDKFVGDEVMASFDGPDKELNACRAGMAIRAAMAKEQERARKEGKDSISIGIGINSGPVVFGSVGARDRMDFTSIGDTVNLAARLEGANKTYGTKSLITETVYEKIKGSFLCREIDLMTVKGKTQPVRIYEVLQERRAAAPKLEEIVAGFERGLAAYRNRDWKKAREAFAKVAETYGDEPSAVFLKRAELFEASPPAPAWDGVFAMTVK
jgi:class 3 adenylate cyclase